MRKFDLLLLTAFSTAFLISGCGSNDKSVPQTAETEPAIVVEDSVSNTPVAKTPSEEEPAEVVSQTKEGYYRSPLTNEWIANGTENDRPIAVMINNIQAACPQTGISQAGIMYECVVEGSLTRLMAIFEDYDNIKKIGPVRSCRDYYVYWALEWDSIYCHFGGPELYVNSILEQDYVDNLDGTLLDGGTDPNASVFFRTTDRKAPHNAYLSGPGVNKGIEKSGFSKEHTSNYQKDHYLFTSETAPIDLGSYPGSISAVHIEPGYLINKPYFEYNASDGLYYRWQYGDKHIDTDTGEQISFKNIILQNTYHETRDAKGYLAFQCHDTTRDGYYITNGKAIHVTWEKTSDFGATRYYDDSGSEIVLNTGKTFVCIIQDQNKDAVVIK